MKKKKIISVWDHLISTLPSEEGDIDNNISALYLDSKGGEYDITFIDPSLEVIKKEKPLSNTIIKYGVEYNGMDLVKYITTKKGYKIKIVKDKPKECKLTSRDKKKRSRI